MTTLGTFDLRVHRNRDKMRFSFLAFLLIGCVMAVAIVTGDNLLAETKNVASLPKAASTTTGDSVTWRSGGVLPGRLIGGDKTTLNWRVDNLFGQPLELQRDYLQSINFDTTDQSLKTKEPFGIQIVDGQMLFGNVLKLDETSLTFTSDRTGEIKIDRTKIATILNLANTSNVAGGEIEFDQWEADRGLKKYWEIDQRRHLKSKRANTHLYHKQKLPRSVLVELELSWEKTLDFSFGFGVPGKKRDIETVPRLESWDGTLVLSYGDDFEPVIEEIDNEKKSLRLLIHWDRDHRNIVIHDQHGKMLASAKLAKPSKNVSPGLIIVNKTGDLTVEHLSIRNSALGFVATEPSIQVQDAPAINGRLKSFDGKQWQIANDQQPNEEAEPGAEDKLTAAQETVETKVFCGAFLVNPATARVSETDLVHFVDGMSVAGELVELTEGEAVLHTSFSDQPVRIKLDGARRLDFYPESESDSQMADGEFNHRLTTPVGGITGRLESGEASDESGRNGVLHWRVPGAKHAVSILGGNAKIVLLQQRRLDSKDDSLADTLYLKNRDVVPCRITAITKDVVEFESFTEKKRIDSTYVKAIDLHNSFAGSAVAIDDKEWLMPAEANQKWVAKPGKKRKVRIKGDAIEAKDQAKFGHSRLLATGNLSFDLKWKGNYGLLECNMLSTGSAADASGQKISFVIYNNQISATGGSQQNAHQHQGGIAVTNNKANIKIRHVKGRIRVTINGKKALSKSIDSQLNNGRGVSFTVKQLYNQSLRFHLSNFEIGANEGSNSNLVDPARKSLLLTLPRLKKLNPPKQILCAHNGDLLRGEVLDMNEAFLKFRANQADLRFPRSVVGSIIWLHAEGLTKQAIASADPADEGESPIDEASEDVETDQPETANSTDISGVPTNPPVQILMHGDQRITAELSAWKDGDLVGESETLGVCRVPLEQVYELRMGSFATGADDVPYSDWVASLGPEPKMDSVAGGDQDARLFGGDSPLIGKTANAFEVPLLDGKTFTLSKQRGKVVVLDFWATWCGPCVRSLPEMAEITSSYSADDVSFIALNQAEGEDTIKEFMERRKLDFPVGKDDGKIAKQFNMEALPLTVLIDRAGKIAFVKVGSGGSKYKEQLKSAIDQLLEQTTEPKKNLE